MKTKNINNQEIKETITNNEVVELEGNTFIDKQDLIIKLLEDMKVEKKLEAKNKLKIFWISISFASVFLFMTLWFFVYFVSKTW